MEISFEQAAILFAKQYRDNQLSAIGGIIPSKKARADSAYDEWLEENLDKFASGDEELEFANWKDKSGHRIREAENIDDVEKAWDEYSKERRDGGPGSGNWNHKGVPGQVGGSAPSQRNELSESSFSKQGSGDFEITRSNEDMFMTETARKRFLSSSKQVKSFNDFKKYLSERGIKLSTKCEPLLKRSDDAIPAVKKQIDDVIAAIEQYDELGGLSSVKEIHFYDSDIDAQAQYSYRANGEGEVEDEGHLYLSQNADGYHILHEFAHAYADSTKPKGMDLVEWSEQLIKTCDIPDGAHSYFGSSTAVRSAEVFADTVASGLAFGKTDRLKFVAEVFNEVHGTRSDGGPGSGNFGHEGRPGEIGGSAPTPYGALDEKTREQVEQLAQNPMGFGMGYDAKRKRNRDAYEALRASGAECSIVERDGYTYYHAIHPKLSYEENSMIDHGLNGFNAVCTRKAYIEACEKAGEKPRFHFEPEEVDKWDLATPKGKIQSDGTPVYYSLDHSKVLSDSELAEYSGFDDDLNPEGYQKSNSAAAKAKEAMSQEQISALNGYTKQYGPGTYDKVNRYLSTGDGDDATKKAAALVTSATDHPIGVDCLTSRGTNELHDVPDSDAAMKIVEQISKGNYTKAGKLKEMLEGKAVTNPAAMSTSPGGPTSKYGTLPIQYIFKTPANAKAVDITSISAFGGGRSEVEKKLAATGLFGSVEHESEVLFHPGTKYRIDRVDFSFSRDGKKKRGQVFITATILTGNEDCRTDADEPDAWVTINGTHVPLDENGEITGNVAEKVKNEEKNPGRKGPASKRHVEIGAKMKPATTDYEYSEGDSKAEWERKNIGKLKSLAKQGGREALDSEWRKFRMEQVTKDVHEISEDEADAVIYDNVSQSVFDGWYRGAGSGYKPKLVDYMLSSKEMRNAGLSLAYENYKNCTDSPLSFEEFLTTPIKMYRGGHGQKHTKDDIFSAYTFDRKTAEHFAGSHGKITEAKIRPIDTYGSMRAVGEAEIWVPSEIAPNGNMDGANVRKKFLGLNDLKMALAFAVASAKNLLENHGKPDIVKSETNLDGDDDPDSWITMPNGVHVPVKNGKAVGGPIIGKEAKGTEKTKPLSSFKMTKRMTKREYKKVMGELNTYFDRGKIRDKIGKHCGWFVDQNFYIFVPDEFGSYGFEFRIPIVGEEEVINEWRSLFNDRDWK